MTLTFALQNIDEAAQQFLKLTVTKNIFAFNGQMGAGKTTFISALCKAMGIVEPISSPTFSIINQYYSLNNKTVYHIDLYRLKDEEEVVNAGVEDCLYSQNICFVEWPNIAQNIFPENTLQITITIIDANNRQVDFNL